MHNKEFLVDCCRTGHCCGLHREHSTDKHPEGIVAYVKDEKVPKGIKTTLRGEDSFIPIKDDGTCLYLKVFNNGFTECTIYDKRPKMCRLYNCLTEKKIKYLNMIIQELKDGCTDTNIIK